MQNMRLTKNNLWLFLIFVVITLSACQKDGVAQTSGVFGQMDLTPFATTTPTPTITATPVNAPTSTPQPTLTPTAQIYITKANDTMWTIAAKAGLTISELTAANPNVDPYTLTSGIQIIIPASSGASGTETAPTPTAIPVKIGSPQCTLSSTGGLYCFAIVENEQEYAIQNITAQFILTDTQSGDKLIQTGLLPLNNLAAGEKMPLFTYFQPPVFSSPTVALVLLSALPVNVEGSNYLRISISDSETKISDDGYSAFAQGKVALADAGNNASRFWIAAVAFDAQGNVVGIRRVEKESPLSSGNSAEFSVYVYSISGKIDHVDLFGEAK